VNKLEDNGPTLEHALTEILAQLDRGRVVGFMVVYVDQHMGFSRAIPGLNEAFDAFCSEEGLLNFSHYHR